jgi:hypothetical protein
MDDRWKLAIDKLRSMTEAQSLQWDKVYDLDRDFRSATVIFPAFMTSTEGKRIAVYEYQFKSFTDEDAWHWSTEVAIEFVDSNDNVEFLWPSTGGRWQLLDAIRRQTSHVDKFLDAFVGNP